jgi:3-oxoacyl-[acyl-carrier protein] reductase
MGKLSGKIAVVTGASRGIGAAIALRLAADGAAVAVNYGKSAQAAEEIVAQIKSKGGTAAAIQADVSDNAQVKKLFETVQKHHGHVDIVVNNAGVWANAPVEQLNADHFYQVFNLNVLGPIQVTAAAVNYFPKTGGKIINITSVAARAALPAGSVYSASKAALDALTLNWAAELGPRNITVNSVSPGVTETEMVAQAPKEFKDGLKAKTPLGRLGQPQDIADVVAFIASDDARWITGQIIDVSGGLRP